MQKDLSSYRKSYDKLDLLDDNLPKSPYTLFDLWFRDTDKLLPENETNAMTLSTLGQDGYPKGRIVLLKKYSEQGFIFFTNYNSDKGKAISNHPHVSLSFFWEGLERQVIIKGNIDKTSDKISNDYFKSRPRGSQLGAHASNQSAVVENRLKLDAKIEYFQQKFINKSIPRPEFWGGYIVKPIEIEFWQGRSNRLHDRIRYKLNNNRIWTTERLSP